MTMATGQIYNQYTKCIQPSGYTGLYLGGGAFLTGVIASIALLLINPGAATFAAILTGIGFCRWWLYARLVCLGNPNACTVGLVLRIGTQEDQSGLGKFDTDYSVGLLLPPNPLKGDQDWYNNMNNPAVYWPDVLMRDQASPNAPADPEYVQMRNTYTTTRPFGFSGESIIGYDLQDQDGYQTLPPARTQALNFLTPPDWQPGYFYNPGDQVRDSNGGIETAVDQGLPARALRHGRTHTWVTGSRRSGRRRMITAQSGDTMAPSRPRESWRPNSKAPGCGTCIRSCLR